jgi:D-glycero-alpha-D-manno-heptose-7-phosphate kinase
LNNLIFSSTPLRISFIGGGTDFRKFYEKKNNFGQVISAAINLRTYCFMKEKNDLNIKNDKLFFNNKIQNKDVYKKFIYFCKKNSVNKKYDIIFYSDIPNGSGLGTSSSFILSLLKNFYKINNKNISRPKLVEMANYFESKLLKRPIGMQDAWGSEIKGIKKIRFTKKKIIIKKINNKRFKNFINKKLFLYPVNHFVPNDKILKNIKKNINKKFHLLCKMNELSEKAYSAIISNNFRLFLKILRESHNIKSQYAPGVVNKKIDNIFSFLKKKKLQPLKILGAGGRGYVLFFCNKLVNLKNINYLDFSVAD